MFIEYVIGNWAVWLLAVWSLDGSVPCTDWWLLAQGCSVVSATPVSAERVWRQRSLQPRSWSILGGQLFFAVWSDNNSKRISDFPKNDFVKNGDGTVCMCVKVIQIFVRVVAYVMDVVIKPNCSCALQTVSERVDTFQIISFVGSFWMDLVENYASRSGSLAPNHDTTNMSTNTACHFSSLSTTRECRPFLLADRISLTSCSKCSWPQEQF